MDFFGAHAVFEGVSQMPYAVGAGNRNFGANIFPLRLFCGAP
jgi:hypothetical protein